MLFYIDAPYSGSMFDQLPKDKNGRCQRPVYIVTGSILVELFWLSSFGGDSCNSMANGLQMLQRYEIEDIRRELF